MARQCHGHLLSKRRSDSALYWPSTGLSAGRGPQRTYGSKLDDRRIPEKYLKATTAEGHLQTRIYQAPRRHQEFAQALNGVIIVKRTLHTHHWAHHIRCRRPVYP